MNTAGTPRQILLNPGPVTLSERVRSALLRGDWCHREPEFAALLQDINGALAAVYPRLAGDFAAVTLACSGTGAVEAMLGSFAPADAVTLVVANGVYGERMARILTAQGKPHRLAQHEWLAAPDAAGVRRYLDRDPGITHLAIVHHETTTGRLNDLRAIGELCRERQVTMLLDAVSSFGAEELDPEGWNLGAVAATANKCLHGVPGLSFVLARRELWEAPPARPRSVYLDLHACYRSQHGDGFSPFTLPVQIAFALREALAELADEGGYEARRRHYRERADRIATVLTGLGVRPLLPPEHYSAVLWSWELPAGQSYKRLHDALKERGFVIYAGQGDLGARIFRVAHMGDIHEDDLVRLEQAFREVLGRAGQGTA